MALKKGGQADQLTYDGQYTVVLRNGHEIKGAGRVSVTPSGGFVCQGATGNKSGGMKDELTRVEDGAGNILWPKPATSS